MERPTWEIPIGKVITELLTCRRSKTKSGICKKTYEIVDNDRMTLRKGDIIKFSSYISRKYPLYAYGEFGVVLERYRIKKEKPTGTFYDYCTVIMMLTGVKKGHITKMGSMKLGTSDKLAI